METHVTEKELWGGETRKAVENFPVSGERVPVSVVRWLGRIKAAAARTNAELGLLDADVAGKLGDEARAHPGGAATTRLAYLVAAVRRGAGRTQGIYDELSRRLDLELQGIDTRSPAYKRGEEAGNASG